MVQVSLTLGYVAVVDEDDLARISRYRWWAVKRRSGRVYARTKINGVPTFMHRFIMGIEDQAILLDHINNDGLDNRKGNLRTCTQSQNQCNTSSRGGSSPYKGVYYEARINRWRGQIAYEKQKYNLGCFTSAEAAALAYDEKAKTLHGEFAKLNFK